MSAMPNGGMGNNLNMGSGSMGAMNMGSGMAPVMSEVRYPGIIGGSIATVPYECHVGYGTNLKRPNDAGCISLLGSTAMKRRVVCLTGANAFSSVLVF